MKNCKVDFTKKTYYCQNLCIFKKMYYLCTRFPLMEIINIMRYQVESSKLLANLTEVVKKTLETLPELECVISTEELVEEAHDQVRIMRAEVRRYDADRRNEPKPCKNYRKIADRIAEQLALRHKWRYVSRAYAYKVMFIMYIICKVEQPIRCSWWERTFLEDLHNYLESTDFFNGTSCRTCWATIMDQLPGQNRLPLDIVPLVSAQQPRYPIIGPVTINNQYIVYMQQTNQGCQQFYGEVNNSTFQEAV